MKCDWLAEWDQRFKIQWNYDDVDFLFWFLPSFVWLKQLVVRDKENEDTSASTHTKTFNLCCSVADWIDHTKIFIKLILDDANETKPSTWCGRMCCASIPQADIQKYGCMLFDWFNLKRQPTCRVECYKRDKKTNKFGMTISELMVLESWRCFEYQWHTEKENETGEINKIKSNFIMWTIVVYKSYWWTKKSRQFINAKSIKCYKIYFRSSCNENIERRIISSCAK